MKRRTFLKGLGLGALGLAISDGIIESGERPGSAFVEQYAVDSFSRSGRDYVLTTVGEDGKVAEKNLLKHDLYPNDHSFQKEYGKFMPQFKGLKDADSSVVVFKDLDDGKREFAKVLYIKSGPKFAGHEIYSVNSEIYAEIHLHKTRELSLD